MVDDGTYNHFKKKNALVEIVKLKRQLYFSIALNVIFAVWVIIIMNLTLAK